MQYEIVNMKEKTGCRLRRKNKQFICRYEKNHLRTVEKILFVGRRCA